MEIIRVVAQACRDTIGKAHAGKPAKVLDQRQALLVCPSFEVAVPFLEFLRVEDSEAVRLLGAIKSLLKRLPLFGAG